MAFAGYHDDIYPLDRIRGNLDGVVASSDPVIIRAHLNSIQSDLGIVMENLPAITDSSGRVVSKNPVWIFSTESTNFLRIQNDIDSMYVGVNEVESFSKDNSAYHVALLDIHSRASAIKLNVMDATPYMYVSVSNIIFSVIWISAIIGIFTVLKKRKDKLKEIEGE